MFINAPPMRNARRGFCYMTKPDTAILIIDGENFRHKITDILKSSGVATSSRTILHVDIAKLFTTVLAGYQLNERRYYSAKIHLHPASKNKSLELIKIQRILKTTLEKQGYKYIISGNVRAGLAGTALTSANPQYVFAEKGVDVKIAVDLTLVACESPGNIVILCSSDSDLQPAIKEATARGTEVIYLGFKSSPNKGLIYTTSKNILIDDVLVIKSYKP